VAVCHLPSPRDRVGAAAALHAAELEAGVSALPLILISPTGQLELEPASMAGRRVERLASPMVLSRFVRAACACLGAAQKGLAA